MKNFLIRLTARITLPFFVAFALCLPATQVYAATATWRMGSTFYPKTASGAVGAAVDIVSLAGRANPWIGALALGYSLYRFLQTFDDATGAAQTANIVAANQNVPTPTGWTVDANGNLVPPSTASTITLYTYDSGTTSGDSYATACSARASAAGYSDGTVTTHNGTPNACEWGYVNGVATYVAFASTFAGCPTGYGLSGSTCSLTNASLVNYPADGIPTIRIKADGSGFQLDPRDPDNASAPSLPTGSLHTDAGKTIGTDTTVDVTPNASGGMDITTMQEYKNSDGTITTYKQTVHTDATGTVTSTTADNYPGSISQQGSGSTALSPSTSTSIPTDYARQGEANAAANSVIQEMQAEQAAQNARTDAMLAETPTTPAIPTQSINVNMSPISFTTDAVCPADITFSIFGHQYAISYTPLCNVASGFRPFFLLIGAITASVVFIRGLP